MPPGDQRAVHSVTGARSRVHRSRGAARAAARQHAAEWDAIALAPADLPDLPL
jgi:hypothetical protein